MRYIIGLLSLSLMLGACGGGSGSDSSFQEILARGLFLSSITGVPVPGVSLRVQETGESVETDENGEFELRFPTGVTPVLIQIGDTASNTLTYPVPQERAEYELTIGPDARSGSYFYIDYRTAAG